MTRDQQTVEAVPGRTGSSSAEALPGVKFAGETGFLHEVRRRVDDYFRKSGRRQRDCQQMYLKTAIILTCCAASYIGLVFVAGTWWLALALAMALGLSMAAIGFNVQHDGRHHAYSNREWVNRL